MPKNVTEGYSAENPRLLWSLADSIARESDGLIKRPGDWRDESKGGRPGVHLFNDCWVVGCTSRPNWSLARKDGDTPELDSVEWVAMFCRPHYKDPEICKSPELFRNRRSNFATCPCGSGRWKVYGSRDDRDEKTGQVKVTGCDDHACTFLGDSVEIAHKAACRFKKKDGTFCRTLSSFKIAGAAGGATHCGEHGAQVGTTVNAKHPKCHDCGAKNAQRRVTEGAATTDPASDAPVVGIEAPTGQHSTSAPTPAVKFLLCTPCLDSRLAANEKRDAPIAIDSVLLNQKTCEQCSLRAATHGRPTMARPTDEHRGDLTVHGAVTREEVYAHFTRELCGTCAAASQDGGFFDTRQGCIVCMMLSPPRARTARFSPAGVGKLRCLPHADQSVDTDVEGVIVFDGTCDGLGIPGQAGCGAMGVMTSKGLCDGCAPVHLVHQSLWVGKLVPEVEERLRITSGTGGADGRSPVHLVAQEEVTVARTGPSDSTRAYIDLLLVFRGPGAEGLADWALLVEIDEDSHTRYGAGEDAERMAEVLTSIHNTTIPVVTMPEGVKRATFLRIGHPRWMTYDMGKRELLMNQVREVAVFIVDSILPLVRGEVEGRVYFYGYGQAQADAIKAETIALSERISPGSTVFRRPRQGTAAPVVTSVDPPAPVGGTAVAAPGGPGARSPNPPAATADETASGVDRGGNRDEGKPRQASIFSFFSRPSPN